MKKLLISALFMLIVSSTQAGDFNSAGNITEVNFWKGHTGVLVVHESMVNPENCSRSDQYILRENHPFFKEIYSMLLSSHIASQPVRFGLKGCFQGFPSIVHVKSKK